MGKGIEVVLDLLGEKISSLEFSNEWRRKDLEKKEETISRLYSEIAELKDKLESKTI